MGDKVERRLERLDGLRALRSEIDILITQCEKFPDEEVFGFSGNVGLEMAGLQVLFAADLAELQKSP